LRDNRSYLRDEAAEALGKIGNPGSVEPFINALKDKNCHTRLKAAEILDKIGWKSSNNRESALYLAAKQEWNKLPAVGKEAVGPLIDALKEEELLVRSKAVKALGKIGDAGAVEPIIKALKDKASFVREKAAEALGEIGDPLAIEPLFAALRDNHPHVRREAQNALKIIHRNIPTEDFGFICGKCFYRSKKHKVKISSFNTFNYYACRNCHSNSYLIEGIEKAVLSVDRNFEETSARDGGTLTVNWFKRKKPFDFDEIHIIDANDFDVEELVMKLKNDMDNKRRKRLHKTPVYLSPGLKISRAKMNLLNDNFKIVIREP
jgi:hypothetical protein